MIDVDRLGRRYVLLLVLLPAVVVAGLFLASRSEAMIYYANDGDGSIGRMNLDGKQLQPKFIKNINYPEEVAVSKTHVYWADFLGNRIGRATLDGKKVNRNFIVGIGGADGLEIVGKYLYWTSFSDRRIGRSLLNGKKVKRDFIEVAAAPDSLASDGKYLYWSNSYSSIGRVKLNGKSLNPSWYTPPGPDVWGLTASSGHVYWSAFVNGTKRIGRISVNRKSKNDQLIPRSGHGGGLAIFDNQLYWTDESRDRIGRANLAGKKAKKVKKKFASAPRSPWGLAVDWIKNTGSNFKIGTVKNRALTVDNPGPGKITVSGNGLTKVSVKAKGPNTKVKLKLTPAFAAILANEGIREIGVKVTFKPSLGSGKKTKTRRVLIR